MFESVQCQLKVVIQLLSFWWNLDVIDKSCTVNRFKKSRQDVRATSRGEEFQRRVRLTVRPLLASANNTELASLLAY